MSYLNLNIFLRKQTQSCGILGNDDTEAGRPQQRPWNLTYVSSLHRTCTELHQDFTMILLDVLMMLLRFYYENTTS